MISVTARGGTRYKTRPAASGALAEMLIRRLQQRDAAYVRRAWTSVSIGRAVKRGSRDPTEAAASRPEGVYRRLVIPHSFPMMRARGDGPMMAPMVTMTALRYWPGSAPASLPTVSLRTADRGAPPWLPAHCAAARYAIIPIVAEVSSVDSEAAATAPAVHANRFLSRWVKRSIYGAG